jgi:predicted HicB family RNase H-like nuclease
VVDGIRQTVTTILAEFERDDGDPPPSLTDRHYSGTFLVRTSPMLHGRLMVE